jgi:hypothetical protein
VADKLAADFDQFAPELEYTAYQPVPYAQGGGAFVAGLSILDAVFHLGWDATAGLIRRG